MQITGAAAAETTPFEGQMMLDDCEAAREAAARFHDDTYRAVALVAYAFQGEDPETIAVAAREAAEMSVRLSAQALAAAARQLVTLGREPGLVLEQTLAALARAFQDVEMETRSSLDRDMPLFI